MKEAPSGTPMVVMPPVLPPPNATAAQLAKAAEIRRAHPLYADVTLRLLTEIMNSRLFTTVCFLECTLCFLLAQAVICPRSAMMYMLLLPVDVLMSFVVHCYKGCWDMSMGRFKKDFMGRPAS